MFDHLSLSFVYGVARDLVSRLWPRPKQQLTDQQRIERRTRLRAEFESNLTWQNDLYRYGQAIIRDIARADVYPELDSKNGISPWFKMAIVGLYHKGVEVAWWTQGIRIDPESDALRLTEVTGEEPDMQLHLIRRIPFDWIVSVGWSGDEYYPGSPMIYCEFASKRGEPYEEVVLSKEVEAPERNFYQEVADYREVYKASKRWKRWRVWRAAQ